nr:MAG TPA: hypothetical protein [Caudoviricetes sp.]
MGIRYCTSSLRTGNSYKKDGSDVTCRLFYEKGIFLYFSF